MPYFEEKRQFHMLTSALQFDFFNEDDEDQSLSSMSLETLMQTLQSFFSIGKIGIPSEINS